MYAKINMARNNKVTREIVKQFLTSPENILQIHRNTADNPDSKVEKLRQPQSFRPETVIVENSGMKIKQNGKMANSFYVQDSHAGTLAKAGEIMRLFDMN